MVPPLPQVPEFREVTVNGKRFLWTSQMGLDPNAVVELKGFIYSLVGASLKAGCQSGNCFEDLTQNAFIAAMKAAESFNPDRGTAFITYASYFIKGAISDGLGDRLIRTPGSRRPYSFVPTDKPYQDNVEATPLEWLLPAAEWKKLANALENSIMQQEELGRLREHLQGLAPQHRRVLELLFGLRGGEPMTPTAVANRMGISRTQVTQIRNIALETLRASLSTPRCQPTSTQNARKRATRTGRVA